MYTAYKLTDKSIGRLKLNFDQKYPDFIGHHITVKFGVNKDEPLPEETDEIEVVGEVAYDGVQALLVTVNGSTKRDDGSHYHITWSLDKSKGKKPVDSNKIIHLAQRTAPIKIKAVPTILG